MGKQGVERALALTELQGSHLHCSWASFLLSHLSLSYSLIFLSLPLSFSLSFSVPAALHASLPHFCPFVLWVGFSLSPTLSVSSCLCPFSPHFSLEAPLASLSHRARPEWGESWSSAPRPHCAHRGCLTHPLSQGDGAQGALSRGGWNPCLDNLGLWSVAKNSCTTVSLDVFFCSSQRPDLPELKTWPLPVPVPLNMAVLPQGKW